MTEKEKELLDRILHPKIIEDKNDLRFTDYSTITCTKPKNKTKPNRKEKK